MSKFFKELSAPIFVTGRSAALGCLLLLGMGCSSESARNDVPAPWTAPADLATTYPVELAPPRVSAKLLTALVEINGESARIGCPTCHVEGSVPALAHDNDTADVHAAIVLQHGDLRCSSCHAPDQPDQLHDSAQQRFPIEESMKLCSQCHGLIRRAYDNGAHGGMRGYWDLQRGPRTRNDCIACHAPHAPALPQVTPVAGPNDRSDRKAVHAGSAIEQRLYKARDNDSEGHE